jgi:hypothetical protein
MIHNLCALFLVVAFPVIAFAQGGSLSPLVIAPSRQWYVGLGVGKLSAQGVSLTKV